MMHIVVKATLDCIVFTEAETLVDTQLVVVQSSQREQALQFVHYS